MAAARKPLVALTASQICEINREQVLTFGGNYVSLNDNLCHANSLHYVVEAIQSTAFGVDLYPTIEDKASALATTIIKKHVFNDGNKRTGLEAARMFLEFNGRELTIDEEAIKVSVQSDACTMSQSDLTRWLLGRCSLSDP